ncbi:MAG: hypothetical protein ACRC41_16475 [Sarcina sp.]
MLFYKVIATVFNMKYENIDLLNNSSIDDFDIDDDIDRKNIHKYFNASTNTNTHATMPMTPIHPLAQNSCGILPHNNNLNQFTFGGFASLNSANIITTPIIGKKASDLFD